ncbi:neuropeptide-like precursor 1 isoform X2 [Topomyia yanbarensis]|uniref:neuropeptide-like precursor 1 isoform X2 n=1 Tax=Topomyia yanbarensis TaxID=2498891 RepID=UPI00273ADECB|nr:neuropeptide-like precursor 1 isoform X2 [Topomyia yanbarensis]
MGNFGILLPPKLLLRISMLLFLVVHDANCQYTEGSRRLKPCELESLLRDLTYPEEGYEMHAAALRNQLRNILERDPTDGGYQSLDEYGGYENTGPYEDKRSYRSLLRDGPVFGKRNLGSLARAGMLRTPSDYIKRSIATLAKNGQLPSNREPDAEESSLPEEWSDDKRNLGSAFRSGYMRNGKRNIASLARKYELPGKRNFQSLLRTGMLPSIAPKRSMQSLARDNALPHYAGGLENKRNIQTLVRDWNLPKHQGSGTGENEKRNIQSLKNSQGHNGGSSGGRKKRELYYDDETLDDSTPEILEPVYQSAPLDYEELMEAMSEAYPYYAPAGNHLEEKRFLGSLARAGMLNRYHRWYHKRSAWSLADSYDDAVDDYDDESDKDSDEQESDEDAERVYESPQKRHIASLARSGWLPSFRPSRAAGRFSRSGRARSQIVELYLQPERLRQPTAAVCRRCDTIGDGNGLRGAPSPYISSSSSTSTSSSWGAPGLQSTWGSTPPRVTALHWRRFRDSTPTLRRRIARGTTGVLRRFQ